MQIYILSMFLFRVTVVASSQQLAWRIKKFNKLEFPGVNLCTFDYIHGNCGEAPPAYRQAG